MTTKTVVAQSFKLARTGPGGQATATVIFICPHCIELHSRREIYSAVPANFREVFYSLECGDIRVVMPWAKQKA